jgi:hypothetical protein
VNKKDEMLRHQPYYQFPKLTKSEIDNFLKKLESVHMQMIEKAVYIKQEQGFPEANEIINYIKSKK